LTLCLRGILKPEGFDCVDEKFDFFFFEIGIEAVAEVGDVTVRTECAEHFFRFAFDRFVVGVQQAGISVALQSFAGPDQLTRFFNVHRPVEADGAAVELAELATDEVRVFCKNGDGNQRLDLIADLRDITQRKFAVLVR
jgi:hypothetical protein